MKKEKNVVSKDTNLFVEMSDDECQTYVSIIYRPYEYRI